MRQDDNIKTMLFTILCISDGIWAMGYAVMLIAPNIQIANIWIIFTVFGGCIFNGLWVSFVFSLKYTNQKKSNLKIQFLVASSLLSQKPPAGCVIISF